MKQFLADRENQYHKLKKVGCEYSDMIWPSSYWILASSQLSMKNLFWLGSIIRMVLRRKLYLNYWRKALQSLKVKVWLVDRENDEKAIKKSVTLTLPKWKKFSWQKAGNHQQRRDQTQMLQVVTKEIKTSSMKISYQRSAASVSATCNQSRRRKVISRISWKLIFHTLLRFNFLRFWWAAKSNADEIILITEDMVCLATAVVNEDCVCPNTVAGEKWIMAFIKNLSPEDKKRVKLETAINAKCQCGTCRIYS